MVQCCHGGSDLKLGGKCFVGSEFRAEVKLPESSEITSQQWLPISLIDLSELAASTKRRT